MSVSNTAKTFEQVFHEWLDDIERRGQEVGMTITHICRDSGVARATPDRWRVATPLSVTLIDKMAGVVAAAEKKAK